LVARLLHWSPRCICPEPLFVPRINPYQTMQRSVYAFIMLFIFTSCTSEEVSQIPDHIQELENLTIHGTNPEPSGIVTLNEEQIFEETDDVLWGRVIRDMTTDDEGRVFIADMASNMIHAYNSEGIYQTSLGRQGQGPGEFNEIWNLKTDDKHLHVLDLMHQRTSLFDLNTLSHVKDIDVGLGQSETNPPEWLEQKREKGFFYRAMDFKILPNTNYLLFFNPVQSPGRTNEGQTIETSLFSIEDERFIRHGIHLLRADGTALFMDERDGGGVWSDAVFNPRARYHYTSDKIIIGWDEKMLFRIYDKNGTYQSAFFYPFQNSVIEMDVLLRLYMDPDESTNQILRKYAPEFWPAFDDLIVDGQNRLWVSTIVDDFDTREWWVMDLESSGKLLGQFLMPRNERIRQIKNGNVYTIKQDFEVGLRKVVRYSLFLNID